MRTACHCFLALALAAPFAIVAGAYAQTPHELVDACDAESEDALARRACYARALSDAEAALDATVNAMRVAVGEQVAAPDRRRSALAAIDSAQSAWRLLRDHDCAYEAAVAPGENDQSRVQMTCAIARTDARRAALAAESPTAEPAETTASANANDDMAAVLERVAVLSETDFRDWRAVCTIDGVCTASTVAHEDGAAVILYIERSDPREDWRLSLMTPASPARAGEAIRLAVDQRDAITFQPDRDVAIGAAKIEFLAPMKTAGAFSAMQAGLDLTVEYTDAEGALLTGLLSLRGMSAALGWVESTQEALSN